MPTDPEIHCAILTFLDYREHSYKKRAELESDTGRAEACQLIHRSRKTARINEHGATFRRIFSLVQECWPLVSKHKLSPDVDVPDEIRKLVRIEAPDKDAPPGFARIATPPVSEDDVADALEELEGLNLVTWSEEGVFGSTVKVWRVNVQSELTAALYRIDRAAPETIELDDARLQMLNDYLIVRDGVEELLSRLDKSSTYHGDLEAEMRRQERLRLVCEYNRKLREGAGSASVSQCPDVNGYVESPADPDAYAPVVEIVGKHMPSTMSISDREVTRMAKAFEQYHIRWTRPVGRDGKPRDNRCNIHLGDWARHVKRYSDDGDDWPSMSRNEVEQRKEDAFNLKRANW